MKFISARISTWGAMTLTTRFMLARKLVHSREAVARRAVSRPLTR